MASSRSHTSRVIASSRSTISRMRASIAAKCSVRKGRRGGAARDDLDPAAVFERPLEIEQLAVELDQQGLLLERLRDGGGDLAARHPIGEFTGLAVGERQLDHRSSASFPPGSRALAAPGRIPGRRMDGNGTG